jgi:hypothetical protein
VRRSAVTPSGAPRAWGHLEASRAGSALCPAHCRRPDTGERRGHNCASTYQRQDTHRKGNLT